MEEDSLTTEKISATLMQQYLQKGHQLFIDNYYTSISLAKYFMEIGTHVTGTIRDNRKNFPQELKAINLQKQEAAFYESNGVVVLKFRAKKDKARGKPKIVNVLTTAFSPAMGNTNRRDRDGNTIMKPSAIVAYNHNMGGIDIMDQQLDGIDVLRKSYKWYKKLFLRLVMQCALSAHKLYRLQQGKDAFLIFLLEVYTQLLENSPRLDKSLKSVDNIARLTGRNHWPARRDSPEDWNKSKSKLKKCRVCLARGRRTPKGDYPRTVWMCKGCPETPGLCVDKDCFEV